MENSTMFIVGFSIFAAYMGYLTMIYRANKEQEEEMKIILKNNQTFFIIGNYYLVIS